MAGFHSRASCGSNSWRMRLRANCEAAIGGIFAPGDAALEQELPDLGALHLDQRPDNALGRDRPDAGQPGGPGAAQKTEQDGFGLVRAGVAQCHALDRAGRRWSRGRRPAAPRAPACSRLPARLRRRRSRGAVERQAQSLRQSAHEFGVLAGFLAAQAVVQVQHAQTRGPSAAPVRAGRAAGTPNRRRPRRPRRPSGRARTCRWRAMV